MNYDRCQYPECNGVITASGKDTGLCNRHTDSFKFIVWVLASVGKHAEEEIKKREAGIDHSKINIS